MKPLLCDAAALPQFEAAPPAANEMRTDKKKYIPLVGLTFFFVSCLSLISSVVCVGEEEEEKEECTSSVLPHRVYLSVRRRNVSRRLSYQPESGALKNR